jgi:serine protease Do
LIPPLTCNFNGRDLQTLLVSLTALFCFSVPGPSRNHAFGQTVAGSPAKSTAQRAKELQPSDLFKLVSPSVFTVESIGKDGTVIAFGSGVAVDANKVVTNIHVIEGGDTWRVKQGGKSWPATVKYADREHDLCALEVDGLRAKAAAVRASSTLEVGERVFAIGSPEGLEVTLSDGLISGIRDFDHSRAIQTTAAISKRSSGGGLFDAGARLMGITTFFVKEGQNLNFALPADLMASLSARGVPVSPRTAAAPPGFRHRPAGQFLHALR